MTTDTDDVSGAATAAPVGRTDRSPPWLALDSDEEIRWRGRPRVQTVYPWVALSAIGMVGFGTAVALGVLSVRGLLWIPVLAALPVWEYVRIARTEFLLTDRRLATRRGVLGVSVDTVALERVQNTTVSQNSIGRVVGYGTVAIETAGGSNPAFWNVEDPIAVRATLEAAADRLEGSGVPGSRAQWLAVLEEVRGWRRALDGGR